MTIHPKWISIASTLMAPSVLLVIELFPNPYVFVGALGVWLGYFVLILMRYKISPNQTALHVMTAVSLVILLLLIESVWMRYFFIIFSGMVFFFIAYWSEPRIEHAIHIKEKPLRRMMMMLYVFNVYAGLLGLFAFHLYFARYSFWWLSVLGGAYAGLGAYMIWHLYFKTNFKQLMVWAIIIGLCIIELMWVVRLLPFGYLASGLLVVWLWYLMQLFVRFHLSPHGVVWRKQVWFLVTNAAMYGIVLYLVQWI